MGKTILGTNYQDEPFYYLVMLSLNPSLNFSETQFLKTRILYDPEASTIVEIQGNIQACKYYYLILTSKILLVLKVRKSVIFKTDTHCY